MKNEVAVFQFNENDVRILSDESGEPWFVAKDVCDALELDNVTRAIDGLDKEDLTLLEVRSGGQNRAMNVVSEPGLYNLIFKSKKPEAKSFKRWVTHEVLPSIRKTGSYLHGNNQPLEAMVTQIVSMVVPAVIDKVMPIAEQFENKLEQTRSDFSHYSSVSGFYHLFCQPDSRNVVVLKDKLYDVYRQYCEAQGAKPFAKPYFCGKFYRAVTGCTSTTVTINGRRVPAVRGISLLPGWPPMMADIKRQEAEKTARELARRRKYYFGIEPDSLDEVVQS